MLIEAAWPDLPPAWIDREADADIDWLIRLISETRAVRSELNVPPSARPTLGVIGASAPTAERLSANAAQIGFLSRVSGVQPASDVASGAVTFVVDEATFTLPVADYIDLAAERARLRKAVAAAQSDADRVLKKLDNPSFMAKAPEAVVEENRAKLAEAQAAKAKLSAALSRLETLG